MKTPKIPRKNPSEAMVLHDRAEVFETGPASEEAMVRTQIYLTRAEHEYLQGEASRRGEPMAAVIRSIIDEKMSVPDEAWSQNPLLEPTPEAADWQGHEDGALNHDHYIYGGAKKYEKVKNQWVKVPDVIE